VPNCEGVRHCRRRKGSGPSPVAGSEGTLLGLTEKKGKINRATGENREGGKGKDPPVPTQEVKVSPL